jgi:addiction module HigA family antidote
MKSKVMAHPGRLLKRELTTRSLSANRLALDIGVPSGRITDILNGRRSITADTAVRLGRYFGNSAILAGPAKPVRHRRGRAGSRRGDYAPRATSGRGVGVDHGVKPGGDECVGWLSQRVRPEVAGPMTSSAAREGCGCARLPRADRKLECHCRT